MHSQQLTIQNSRIFPEAVLRIIHLQKSRYAKVRPRPIIPGLDAARRRPSLARAATP